MQDFEERGIGRFSRHRNRQPHHHPHHQQTYRSTGMGGWERHYAGLSDSDLTMHSLEPRLRPKHSLSPDKDFMGDFGDSDMESVVSVTVSFHQFPNKKLFKTLFHEQMQLIPINHWK